MVEFAGPVPSSSPSATSGPPAPRWSTSEVLGTIALSVQALGVLQIVALDMIWETMDFYRPTSSPWEPRESAPVVALATVGLALVFALAAVVVARAGREPFRPSVRAALWALGGTLLLWAPYPFALANDGYETVLFFFMAAGGLGAAAAGLVGIHVLERHIRVNLARRPRGWGTVALASVFALLGLAAPFLILQFIPNSCSFNWQEGENYVLTLRGAMLVFLGAELLVGVRWAVLGNGPPRTPAPLLCLFSLVGFPLIAMMAVVTTSGVRC